MRLALVACRKALAAPAPVNKKKRGMKKEGRGVQFLAAALRPTPFKRKKKRKKFEGGKKKGERGNTLRPPPAFLSRKLQFRQRKRKRKDEKEGRTGGSA